MLSYGAVMEKVKLTTKQAAERIGVNWQTLGRWDRSGKLKARREKFSNYRYYTEEDIEKAVKYLDELRMVKKKKIK